MRNSSLVTISYLVALVFVLSTVSIDCKSVCYDDLGCFVDTPPFSGTKQRPVAVLPETPQKINTIFTLYTRETNLNPTSGGIVITSSNLKQVKLDCSTKKTKFLTHGYRSDPMSTYLWRIRDAILRVEDANVIVVDWRSGNSGLYTQATANAQLVGAEVARILGALKSEHNCSMSDMHLIGHSLGAHISGYAGKRVPGIGRITGLDPAGPYFENADKIVRLDSTDATFVDVIHTDGLSLLKLGVGLDQALGHVDFYPNGGNVQPYCPTTSDKLLNTVFNAVTLNLDDIKGDFSCNHHAAYRFFIDSITNTACTYTSYPCASEEDFEAGKCMQCSAGVASCNSMGYWASPSKDQGTLYLSTNSGMETALPLCHHDHTVRLVSNGMPGMLQARGFFTMFVKQNEMTTRVDLITDKTTLKANSDITTVVSSYNLPDVLAPIQSVFVGYTKSSLISFLYDSSWSFRFIEWTSGERQHTVKLCPVDEDTLMPSGKLMEYKPCL